MIGFATPASRAPRPGAALKQRLADDGITAIPDIPPDYEGLSPLNALIREAVVSGEAFHDPAVGEVLRGLEAPPATTPMETAP